LENILIAFVTGLTTGGLSCLAVQGGLLASSLSNQIEESFLPSGKKSKKGRKAQPQTRPEFALPITVFLLAKLLAYTLLGSLLGLVGQMFQLSPYARAFLQIAIGIFMLGTALRMLNVHPIFRIFAFEPPAFIRRKLRKTAAGNSRLKLFAPAFTGFLTVLIPCGVTQAMMAVALGAGSPLEGAALMFAFTLGTSPLFFAVTYFATRIGEKLERHFNRFVAVVVIILAVITIDSGISLAGSPYSLTRWASGLFSNGNPTAAEIADGAALPDDDAPRYLSELEAGPGTGSETEGESVIAVDVKNSGYSPEVVYAKSGVPVTLQLKTNNVRSCSRAFIIPALNVQTILEATGVAEIDIPAQEKGTRIPFSCSMGMFTGMIIFN
jgi:sulfite exporter TauE/SafE